MDLKETLRYVVTASDVDSRGFMTPKALIRQLTLAATYRNRNDGCSKQVLRAKFDAVWMFRRIKLEQYKPLREGDELVGYGSGRTNNETEYIIRGIFKQDGEDVAYADFAMMPVALKERHKIPCAEIEPAYNTQPLNEVPVFPRLTMLTKMVYNSEKTITEADCDENVHFASQNYADLVCNETGYFEGDYRLMKKLQLDFVKECVTGNTIKLGTSRKGSGIAVQGKHKNGKPCFNAYCEYEA